MKMTSREGPEGDRYGPCEEELRHNQFLLISGTFPEDIGGWHPFMDLLATVPRRDARKTSRVVIIMEHMG